MAGGGGGGVGPGGQKKARIEIIPLIDIMFFLLASFMLVSMSMIKLQAIENKLPSAQTAKPVDKPDFSAVGVDSKGQYYFEKDKDPIPLDQVIKRLQPEFAKKGDDLKVFVNADESTTYASVAALLDQFKTMGLKKVSFPVKKDNHFDPNSTKQVVPVTAPAVPANP